MVLEFLQDLSPFLPAGVGGKGAQLPARTVWSLPSEFLALAASHWLSRSEGRSGGAEKGPWYLLVLVTPVELRGHDVHDPGQGLVGSLHVEEGQAGAAGDDVHGRACILLHPVHHLRPHRHTGSTGSTPEPGAALAKLPGPWSSSQSTLGREVKGRCYINV